MLHLEGIPISPGYASGIAVVYDYEIERRLELPQSFNIAFGSRIRM